MDKKFFARILVPTVLLAIAVVTLLMKIPATAPYFTWFNWGWAATGVAGTFAVRYLLGGIFGRNNPILKKTSFLFGGIFAVITVFCLAWAIAMPEDWIAPLIAIIVAGVLFLSVLFTGGRKWDAGDNQKAGYQNYYQRKKVNKDN